MNKPYVHFTDKYLLQPTNPVSVNLIGCGGTGSQVLTALARINHSLIALNHAGLSVRVFDDDVITQANLGRQLFTTGELGLHKSVALINRINRFFGTNWKAIPHKYAKETICKANITISCTDTVETRFDIAANLQNASKEEELNKPLYWMDFGNEQYTGQVVLATVGNIGQPTSRKYRTVSSLPYITEEFEHLLRKAETSNTPSCSLAEALMRQDLFINSSLAIAGAALLWRLFREGVISHRGLFLNLKEFRMQPIPIKPQ
jgi:PRTRC genetic system ThiF family protein